MEHFKSHPSEDQPGAKQEIHLSANRPDAERRTFTRGGEVYEEFSLHIEPMEQYRDDLVQLDRIISFKKRLLHVREVQLQAYQESFEDSERALAGDIAEQIAFLRQEIYRWEIMKAKTQQRLALSKERDAKEINVFNRLSTDGIEH